MDKVYSDLLNTYITEPRDVYEEKSKEVLSNIAKHKHIFKYDELVPYPDYNDPDFNTTIFYKKEFNKNKSVFGSTGEGFVLSNNQKFLKNFLSPFTPYNGLLLFHSVGVGKTCSAISIAERYFDVYKKRVLVILSSNIKDNFKKQIFDINKYDIESNEASLCTGTTYPDMIINKSMLKKEDLERKVNKLINDKYQFIGYKELHNYIVKMKEKLGEYEKDESKLEKLLDDKISETFSNRLIIIDEAHNLRVPSESGQKQLSVAFNNVLKKTNNVKLLLMTATPMFNDASEILSMLNILLTNDKRPPLKYSQVFDKEGNITSEGEDILLKASTGYISYMRGENPYTFPVRLYPLINKDVKVMTQFPKYDINGVEIKDKSIESLQLIGSQMSDLQKLVYDQIGYEQEDIDLMDDEEGNNDMQVSTQISNIVYPTGEVTKFQSWFYSCFQQVGHKNFKLNYDPDVKKKHGEFLANDKLEIFSPKIKSVIDYIVKSQGIVFVYSQYYYSGILPLAIALEHIGFNKYGGDNLMNGISVKNEFAGTKRPSYIILSRDKEISPNNDAEIAAVKAAANKNGEVIKVIIASKIATEGIDFKRIREVHILEPWFNLSRIEQIIGRAVRTYSHIDLPIEDRNVTIYMHALKDDNNKRETTDLRMYRISASKGERIQKVETMLKRNAVDCSLNKEVLSFPKEKVKISVDLKTSQGTLVPGFQLGDEKTNAVKCLANVSESKVDETTFHRVFIIDDIILYKKYISKLFQLRKSYTFEEISSALLGQYKTTIDEEILIYALDEMVLEKYKIFDSLKRAGFLIYKSNLYIFQYARLYDLRMTLEEREEMSTRPSRLDLEKIPKQEEKKKKKKVLLKTTGTVIERIMVFYGKKMTDLKKILPVDVYAPQIMDYIIDRLNRDDFMECIEHISLKLNENVTLTNDEKQITRSLIENEMLLFDKDDKVKYIFHHFEKDLFCLKDGKFQKCTPIDVNKIGKNKYDEILTHKNAGLKPGPLIKGFMKRKGDEVKFKVKDAGKSTTGFICTTAITHVLKEKIVSIEPNVNIEANGKTLLCDVLEIVLRSKGKSAFLRVLD